MKDMIIIVYPSNHQPTTKWMASMTNSIIHLPYPIRCHILIKVSTPRAIDTGINTNIGSIGRALIASTVNTVNTVSIVSIVSVVREVEEENH